MALAALCVTGLAGFDSAQSAPRSVVGTRLAPYGPAILQASVAWSTTTASFTLQTDAPVPDGQTNIRILIDDNGTTRADTWVVIAYDPAAASLRAGIGPIGTAHLSTVAVVRPDPTGFTVTVPLADLNGTAPPQWAAVTVAPDAQGKDVVTSSAPPQPTFVWTGPFRVAGSDRIGTSVASSFFGDGGAQAVVLARSDDFADALSGAPLAAFKDGPLLLTPPNQLDPRVLAEMRRCLLPGSTVYLLGGSAALSGGVLQAVTDAGFRPVRLAGPDRYATSLAVLQQGLGSVSRIFLATGLDFPDALAAGDVAAADGGAVLLTQGEHLTLDVVSYLLGSRATVYAIGSPAAAADPWALSVQGPDRYSTAVAVAERFFPDAKQVGIASGVSFPDAMSAGTTLGEGHSPLLLTDPTQPSRPSVDYMAAHADPALLVFGGSAAISNQTALALATAQVQP